LNWVEKKGFSTQASLTLVTEWMAFRRKDRVEVGHAGKGITAKEGKFYSPRLKISFKEKGEKIEFR